MMHLGTPRGELVDFPRLQSHVRKHITAVCSTISSSGSGTYNRQLPKADFGTNWAADLFRAVKERCKDAIDRSAKQAPHRGRTEAIQRRTRGTRSIVEAELVSANRLEKGSSGGGPSVVADSINPLVLIRPRKSSLRNLFWGPGRALTAFCTPLANALVPYIPR